MSDSKIYRIPQPVFPFPNLLPAPAVSPDDPDSQVCIMVSRYWLPYILGALKPFQYDDIWETPTEQLKNDGQTLLRRFMSVFSCGDDMREIELQSVPSVDCQQFQWRYVGDLAWIDLGEPVCNGADGTDGRSPEFQLVPFDELCQTIQWRYVGDPAWINLGQVCNGEQGEPGECDCVDPVPTQPPVVEGDDRCQQACNIAMGLGGWLWGKYGDSLGITKAALQATGIIADAVSDLIDAIPVMGAVVEAVVDYATGLGILDITALQGANNNEFKEWIQCELYRIMADDTGDFDLAYFDQVKDELQIWGATLPPQGPLLVVIGQMFALFVETIPASEMLRRANVYKDSEENCELCDVACSTDRLVAWELPETTVAEGVTTDIMIILHTPDALPSDLIVNIIAAPGTASEADYNLITTSLIIPAGSIEGDTFPVSVAITGDVVIDPDEDFVLTIDSVVGAAVIDLPHKDHHVIITDGGDCATTADLTINCTTNNTMLQAGWTGCASGVTTYHGTQSITVTLPETKKIKTIRVNWRSAFSPNAPIDDGIITLNGVDYTQDITGSGGTTSPQIIDNLYVNASTFDIATTGTVNGTNPNGYVAFFSIVVTYCEDEE